MSFFAKLAAALTESEKPAPPKGWAARQDESIKQWREDAHRKELQKIRERNTFTLKGIFSED